LAEQRSHLFGEAVRQVLTPRFAAEILKRQHGEPEPGDNLFTPHHLNLCDKSVPLARNGVDKRRLARRITQGPPDFEDNRIDPHFDVDECAIAPQLPHDFATLDKLTSLLDQQDQQIHWSTFEPDRTPASMQRVSCEVQIELAEVKRRA
jgi:hypothetical protein